MDGILIVDKPKGYTSRDVVNIVGKKFGTKRIGHTGTLDPNATGILVLCIGNATKLVEKLTSNDKKYVATITLGIQTDTLDGEGKILREEKAIYPKNQIIGVLNEMIGSYMQEVPIYSAVKINGKKLYEYARDGEDISLPKRLVTIKNIDLVGDIKYDNNKTIFNIECSVSKGTYIRSLVNDIATKLNTVGIMSELRRIKQGNFCISDAYTLDDINNNNYKIISIVDALSGIYTMNVNDELLFKIRNGVKIINNYNVDEILFLDDKNNAVALYKEDEKDSNLLKVYKMF